MGKLLIILLYVVLIVATLSAVIWIWYIADCDTLKAINTQTPARCIR